MKVIAVYGSAILQSDDAVYVESVAMGRALAEAGYSVMTGGYGGVMAAISQGAAEAGGHVIGVTVKATGIAAERQVNRYVGEVIPQPTMRLRLQYLADQADGYLAMPGGIGTLQEIVEVWQQMRIGAIARQPIFCYGDFWRPVLEPLVTSPYVLSQDAQVIQYVQSSADLVVALNRLTRDD